MNNFEDRNFVERQKDSNIPSLNSTSTTSRETNPYELKNGESYNLRLVRIYTDMTNALGYLQTAETVLPEHRALLHKQADQVEQILLRDYSETTWMEGLKDSGPVSKIPPAMLTVQKVKATLEGNL